MDHTTNEVIQELLFSGGGFLAGVICTAFYARATGRAIQWPWDRQDKHGSAT